MEKPKVKKIDFRRIKEQMADIKDVTAEKLKQGADTASEVAAKAVKQGAELTAVAAEKIKQGAEYVDDVVDNAQDAYINWRYRPIYTDALSLNYSAWLPEMINIKNRDDRTDVEGLDKAIGFDEQYDEKPIITVLSKYAKEMDIEFYPALSEDVFYVDPFDRRRYIQIDQYFHTLEQERIEELIGVAQDLGAKYIEIAYSKENRTSSGSSVDANAKVKGLPITGKASASAKDSTTSRSMLGVKKSMNLPGMDPKEPKLKHFKNDIEINSIIDRRLHKENAIKGDYRCELSFNTSSGIKASNAANVEGALKKVGVNVKGKYKVTNEVMREDSQKLMVYLKFPE